MCGIAGRVTCGETVSSEYIRRMCNVIAHRGPDSQGVFVADGVGLGIQRLPIIDLETGDQPLKNEDESVVVVMNGEIYNYRELRQKLRASGHFFATESDTEVLVHLYEECGDDLVAHLRGMFAFALWDVPRRRLLLARDRVGKKPLYYSENVGSLWFGSEAKAILQDPSVSRAVSSSAIDCFLKFQYVPDPMSAFASLKRLPPGHLLTWSRGTTEVRRYWKLRYETDRESPTEQAAAERVRELVLEATRLRLRSDVEVGVHLSGGIDSSVVLAAAAMQSKSRLKSFSIGFGSGRYDEREYARVVARLYDTDHYEFEVVPNCAALLPRMAWHYGEPFADPAALPSFYLSELTSRFVKVALNGDGGDETFAGYPRYGVDAAATRLRSLPRPLDAILRTAVARIGPGSTQGSPRHRLHRLMPLLSLSSIERYGEWISFFNAHQRSLLYTDDFAETIPRGCASEILSRPFASSDASDNVGRLLDVDVQTYLPGGLLVKVDIASMAYSLELRSPLLDQELMEYVAGLPTRLKTSHGQTKLLLRSAVRDWLPPAILSRPKRGFRVPLAEWFRSELRSLPGEVLLDQRALGRGLFRRSAVTRLIDDHLAGTADNAERLWALIQLELWFQTYIDVVPGRGVEVPVGVAP